MQIEITEQIDKKRSIDIDFPYYYKHDVSDDGRDDISVIYGKILIDCEYTIHETRNLYNNQISYNLEWDSRSDCYFKSEYKSTKKEYDSVKQRAKTFFNCL